MIAGAFFVAAMVALSPSAEANFPSTSTSGYPCSANWLRWDSGLYGDFGTVNVILYSDPGCTGTFLGTGYMFSVNATSTLSHPPMEAQVPEVFSAELLALQQAMLSGQRITVHTYTGFSSAIQKITYHAN